MDCSLPATNTQRHCRRRPGLALKRHEGALYKFKCPLLQSGCVLTLNNSQLGHCTGPQNKALAHFAGLTKTRTAGIVGGVVVGLFVIGGGWCFLPYPFSKCEHAKHNHAVAKWFYNKWQKNAWYANRCDRRGYVFSSMFFFGFL